MGDSEDEYDRKRRDKFRGERTESYQRGEGRRGGGGEDRRREEWIERETWGSRNRPRAEYREYRGGGGRERYSPSRTHDISPPMKRVRTDWEDRRGNYGGGSWPHDNYNSQHSYGNHGNNQSNRDVQTSETQPPMMSFKAYLQTQDDNITDDEAIRKYNEYKLEFKRQQLNEFFVAHKEEEWFKIKYHPEDSVKRKDEQMSALKNRVNVFLEILNTEGRLDKVSVDGDQSEQLMRLLDVVVIRLEGGTDFDMQVLDERPKVLPSTVANPVPKPGGTQGQSTDKPGEGEDQQDAVKEEPKPIVLVEDKVSNKDAEEEDEEEADHDKKEPAHPLKLTLDPEQTELQNKATEFLKQQAESEDKPGHGVKRKREYEYESCSESGDEPEPVGENKNGMDEDEPPPPGLEDGKEVVAGPTDKQYKQPLEIQPEEEEGEEEDKKVTEEEGDNDVEDISDKEDDSIKPDNGEPEEMKEDSGEDGEDLEARKPEEAKPRPLHRTVSIFLRNLAPTITKQEVEAMCKRYPGYLRVAIADPQPERRWFRRGWVTFERHVNIKEICWNLNNIRLRDCELGAIVNRDLSRRIRTVNGITSHRQVVRHDIKLSARIVHNLDGKSGLWSDNEASVEPVSEEEEKDQQALQSFGLVSKNPVLKNITDYLIEEGSAEEDELLGCSTEQEDGLVGEDAASVERDDILIKVLDRLLLYLRVVHSVDFYNHCEYPNEDEMPNRCGIMHARGIPSLSKACVTQQEVSDYCRTFEQKIASFLQPACKITEEEYGKLGHKDPEAEVEKFILVNTQELAKDKWLCPLSGKKFKGAEFVRKHIFNKHTEKVDEVKKEVEYFNNYLRDPKRPQLPEHPGNRQQRKEGPAEREGFSGQTSFVPHYQYNYGGRHYGGHNYGSSYGYNQGYNQGYSRPRGGYNRGRIRGWRYFRHPAFNHSRNPFLKQVGPFGKCFPSRLSRTNESVPGRKIIPYNDLDAPELPEDF